MKKTYTGGCQCGKVRYEAHAEIGEVISCNCSRCRKLGSLLSARRQCPTSNFFRAKDDMTGLSVQQPHDPSSILQDLRDPVIRLRQGPGGKDMVMINVRCLDGVDVGAIQGEEIRRRQPAKRLLEQRTP